MVQRVEQQEKGYSVSRWWIIRTFLNYFPPSSPQLLLHIEALWKRESYKEEGSTATCFREAEPENSKTRGWQGPDEQGRNDVLRRTRSRSQSTKMPCLPQ